MVIRANPSAAFEDFVAALLTGDADAVRLVQARPDVALGRVDNERLVEKWRRQLYSGDTPLHLAAAAHRPLVVAALLDAGADPNAVNRRGATALHYACD